jgi:lipid A 3-O-deacylase
VKRILNVAAVLLCAGLIITPAYAQDDTDTNVNYISVGVGIWDISQDDDQATDLRVEYRSGESLIWEIKPWAGLEITTDGSIWGGGGILADFNIADNIYVIPSFGVGLYAQGGSGKDLGSPIEFRSQLEAGYQFQNDHRLGISLSHISNAHLDDKNPGAEIMNIYYHIPFGSIFNSAE